MRVEINGFHMMASYRKSNIAYYSKIPNNISIRNDSGVGSNRRRMSKTTKREVMKKA